MPKEQSKKGKSVRPLEAKLLIGQGLKHSTTHSKTPGVVELGFPRQEEAKARYHTEPAGGVPTASAGDTPTTTNRPFLYIARHIAHTVTILAKTAYSSSAMWML